MKNKQSVQKKSTLWTPLYIRLGVVTILLSFVETMITANMSPYMLELGATDVTIGVVTAVFSGASMIVRFLAGPMMDRVGRLKIGVFGMALSLLPIIGFAVFPVVWVVIIMRFVQGVGFSCASLSQGTMSVDIPDPEHKDDGTGYYGLFYNVATMFGPAFGLYISAKYNYTWLFVISFAMFVVGLFVELSLNYEKKRGIVYSRDVKNSDGEKLTWWENVIERKALPSSIVTFFTSVAYVFVSSFITVFAPTLGLTSTGFFFTIVAFMTFSGRLATGPLIKKGKHALVLTIGNILMAIGMLIIAFMQSEFQMLLGGFVFGTGGGFAWPALAVMAVTNAAPMRRGTATSTYYAFYDLGLALGGLLGGVVAAASGYRSLFVIGALIFVFSAVLTVVIFRKHLKKELSAG